MSSFKRNFGSKKINLNPTQFHLTYVSVHKDEIWLRDLKSCLQFVRCFGEIITDLTIWDGSNDYLNQYIQQYCAETLTSVSFNQGSLSANFFQKPFNNVNAVEIRNVKLQDSLPRFIDWFPNMRHLKIDHRHFDYYERSSVNAVTFPQLEHLTLHMNDQMNYDEFMRANPQIQTITFPGRQISMKRASKFIKHNQSILKLEMWHFGKYISCMYPEYSKRLVRDHPINWTTDGIMS